MPRSAPFDSLDELERIDVPAIVVASRDELDPGHPFAIGEAYAERLPQGRLVTEDEGQSPLAWQGSRLSKQIEELAAGAGPRTGSPNPRAHLGSGAPPLGPGPAMNADLISALTIPIFSGVIGYATNWSGVWMLFYPLEFKGIRIGGLEAFARILPRKIQQVPGVMHGAIGWQGIIPSRAAKMGSIAVDKGIEKVGSPSEFYEQLEPEQIAEHILATSQRDIRELVDRTMRRERPELWDDLPPRIKEAVFERVESQLPEIVHEVTEQIGENIDQLLDIKLMVIRHIEERPEIANRIYLEVGDRELKFIVKFGFFFGFVLGIPTVFLVHAVPHWWVLPIAGTIVGWVTNWLAIWMIFEPVEPRKIGPFTIHGLFLRRQREAADVYADIIADDVVTLEHIGDELLNGPRSDRTRHMIVTALRPGRRPRHRDRPARGARGGGDQGVRRDPRVGRGRGRRLHDDPADRSRLQRAAEPQGPQADRRADARAVPGRLLRDAALGDEGGRVAALPPRRRARIRRRPSSPGDLRGMSRS